MANLSDFSGTPNFLFADSLENLQPLSPRDITKIANFLKKQPLKTDLVFFRDILQRANAQACLRGRNSRYRVVALTKEG